MIEDILAAGYLHQHQHWYSRVPARTLANPIARREYSSTRLVPLFSYKRLLKGTRTGLQFRKGILRSPHWLSAVLLTAGSASSAERARPRTKSERPRHTARHGPGAAVDASTVYEAVPRPTPLQPVVA